MIYQQIFYWCLPFICLINWHSEQLFRNAFIQFLPYFTNQMCFTSAIVLLAYRYIFILNTVCCRHKMFSVQMLLVQSSIRTRQMPWQLCFKMQRNRMEQWRMLITVSRIIVGKKYLSYRVIVEKKYISSTPTSQEFPASSTLVEFPCL